MREIAAEAGVDVALVSYYFGSKRGLFGAAMALPINPVEAVRNAVPGPLEEMPERLLGGLLAVWGTPSTGGPLVAMAAAASSDPAIGRLVGEVVEQEIVPRVAERLAGEDAVERAAAFTTQMAGVIFARYVLRLEPIASLPDEEVLRLIVPALRATLLGGHEGPAPPEKPSRGPR
jgi:AcrR family transcriptional regulator